AQQAQALETQILAQGIGALAQRLRRRVSETTGEASPFRGLLEYRLSDTATFFGRDRAIADMLQALQRSALTVLQAESGAGKTSLLQAGIAPHLIFAGHLPLILRPYDADPALKIKRELVTDLGQTPSLQKAGLRDFLRQVCDILGERAALVIMLDQFEEFFTRLDEADRNPFVRDLADCLDDTSLNVRWVLALRSEYFGNLANFRPRIRNPFENDYRLNRLTRAEAHEAVEKPLARHGQYFEDGLLERLLTDLGKGDVAPPQLQLVCAALYEALPEGETVITATLYAQAGGAAHILRDHLERVLSRDLQPAQRTAARQLLESLITSEQQRVIRTHVELITELARQGVTAQTLDVILGQLIDSRLIKVDETDTGPAYELAHDYLLGEIKLDPDVQQRKAAQELLEQEVRAYRRYGSLLSVDRLQVIEEHRSELLVTEEAAQLICASNARIQQEQRRQRRQRLALGLAVGAVVVIMLAIGPGAALVRRAQNDARKAQAKSANPLMVLTDGEMIFGTDDPKRDRPFEPVSQTLPIAPFAIEQTEVTNASYRLCVEAGACDKPKDIHFFDDDTRAQHPVAFVTALQAAAYCAWLDRRLPTELEWERAARGMKGQAWPWGVEPPTADRAVLLFDRAASATTQPIKSREAGKSPEEVYDLIGNVAEWTSTRLRCEAAACTRDVWEGKDGSIVLAIRGGDFNSSNFVRSTLTQGVRADLYDGTLGFRCAQ
ncbi:MAG TPA: SUMF1/EgtB/PvdO family nonheme iron enzyme, partial [Anaerolineae bacterium]|nr:SUMF1/EgtB/PvdO family nonheme iron enzyme [Anaerolineae bacterium]